MSRSFRRQPFWSFCGAGNSAKEYKMAAHRGERRRHNQALHKAWIDDQLENFLPPHLYECAGNQVYSWNRDGHQAWHGLTARDWAKYWAAIHGIPPYDDAWSREWYGEWPPSRYTEMMRK